MAETGGSTPNIHFGIVADDKATGTIKKVQGELDRLHRRTSLWSRTLGPAVNALIRPFQALGRQIFNLRNIFLAVGAAWTAIRMVDYATKIEAIDASFKSLATRLGTDYLTVLQRLRGATKGTVDDLGLMMAANRAVLLGAASTAEGLDVLARVARRLGRAMGQDTGKSFDDLVLAMGRMQPRILDNIGIVVKQSEAQAKYAKATGKAVYQLTALDRQFAFSNEAIEKSFDKLKTMGEDTDLTLDVWGRLKATILNTYQDLLRGLLPMIEKTAARMTEWIKENKEELFNWIAAILRAADMAIPMLVEALKSFATYVDIALTPLKEMAKILLSIREYAQGIELGKAERNLLKAVQGSNIPMGVAYEKRPRVTAGPWGVGVGEEYVQREDAIDQILKYAKEDTSGRVDMDVYKAVDAYLAAKGDMNEIRRIQGVINASKAPVTTADLFKSGVPPGGFTLGLGFQEAADKIQNLGKDNRDKAINEPTLPKPQYAKDEKTDAVEKATKLQTGLLGVSEALNEIYLKGTDTFTQMKTLVIEVSDSLVDNLADGFTKAIMGAESFAEAMKEMAKSIIEDIIQIILKLVIMRALASAVGMIPGVGSALGAVNAPAITDPFSGLPISNVGMGGLNSEAEKAALERAKAAGEISGKASGGVFGVFNQPTLIAEGPGQIEAAVPLPDGRRIPVEMIGDSGGGGATYIVINTIDAKSFDQYFNESAGRNRKTIGKIASQQFQNDRAVRRGFQA